MTDRLKEAIRLRMLAREALAKEDWLSVHFYNNLADEAYKMLDGTDASYYIQWAYEKTSGAFGS